MLLFEAVFLCQIGVYLSFFMINMRFRFFEDTQTLKSFEPLLLTIVLKYYVKWIGMQQFEKQ